MSDLPSFQRRWSGKYGGLLGALSGGQFDIAALLDSLAGGSGQQQPA
ncbi:hypothetical protein [Rhodococcus sp. AG1013]|nr:hypothetical protein [Rhodococcus sp. AG1013]